MNEALRKRLDLATDRLSEVICEIEDIMNDYYSDELDSAVYSISDAIHSIENEME